MRTVQVDADHTAKYEKTAKNVYAFVVMHAATGRALAEGACRVERGSEADAIARAVATQAQRRLTDVTRARETASTAFADGKPVANAPALPPAHAAARAAGDLDISAALPVKLIRDAYKTVAMIESESPDSWRSRCNHAALDIGHKVLIGAPDALILSIARGEATLTGSLRSGVTVVGITA